MGSIVTKRPMTALLFGLSALLVLLALIIISAWAFQEKIAFQPERPPYPTAGNTTRVEYRAADGQPLFAYVVGDPRQSAGLLLAFHGNADLAVRQIDWAQEISNRTGFAVMLPEYRGYMGLEGKPTYAGSKLDALAAYTFASQQLGVPADRFVFFGHSLGSAIAAELAVEYPPRSLILEAPFTSARDMAALFGGSLFTSGVWPVISRLHFDTIDIVASLDVPVSVSHGGRDVVIPFRMGQEVYDAAKRKGEWLFVPTAAHSDIREAGGQQYWDWLTRSVQQLDTGNKTGHG
jgi:fermentation-respiration switch protein FrsA (DUF1100 family)